MEKDLNLMRQFVCKVCDKKYPCGKSLGGHMRSHVISPPNSAESEENSHSMGKVPYFYEAVGVDGGALGVSDGPTGYELRENPKKTWRAADSTTSTNTTTAAAFALPHEERFCKQCGKGFQSLKALCGHMACHSEKDRFFKDDHCWTDSLYDTEEADDLNMKRQTRSKSKSYKRINVLVNASQFDLPSYDNNAGNGDGGGSSVSEIDEVEVENVAMCLMMLSRDTWNWFGVNSVVESSDNNSVVVETKSSSIGMEFGRRGGLKFGDDGGVDTKKFGGGCDKLKSSALDVESGQYQNSGYLRNGVRKVESAISVDGVFRNGDYKNTGRVEIYDAGLRGEGLTQGKRFPEFGSSSRAMNSKRLRDCSDNPESRTEAIKKMLYDSSDEEPSKNARKRIKYECLNCNKTFDSFQGLGGHRPCHKKPKAKFAATRHENGENSLEVDDITLDSTHVEKIGERLTNKKIVGRDFCGNAEKRKRSKKSKAHKCPVCFRMFKSGQALGGHKRSHFLNGSDDFGNPTVVIKEEAAADVHENHDLIDLNLPAPEADEDDQFVY